MFSLFVIFLEFFKSPGSTSELASSAHDRFLSQATSHAHLEYLEREWDRRANGSGVC